MILIRESLHPPYISELTSELDVDQPYLSKLISTFEEKGWVEKKQDPNNKRRVRIHLTDEGKIIADGLWKLYASFYDYPTDFKRGH